MGFKGKELLFEPVRNPTDWDQVVRNALTFSFQIYRCILLKYWPEEEAAFNQIYVKEWRQRFLNIGKVESTNGTFVFTYPINSQ